VLSGRKLVFCIVWIWAEIPQKKAGINSGIDDYVGNGLKEVIS